MKKAVVTIKYDDVIESCLQEFKAKHQKYGSSWLVFRIQSLADQIFIKLLRVRTIQDQKTQKVTDPIADEFTGIFNYSIFSKIRIKHDLLDLDLDTLYGEKPVELYQNCIDDVKELYAKKNHDYGEAWRDLRISSMVDLSLVKCLRLKQIYLDSNTSDKAKLSDYDEIFTDIANYALFCKVRIAEGANPMV